MSIPGLDFNFLPKPDFTATAETKQNIYSIY